MRVRWYTKPEPSQATMRNIETVLKLEAEFLEQRRTAERVADWVAQHVGSGFFIVLELGFIAAWLAVNGGACRPLIGPFDPYPFNLLSSVLSLEGVLLAAFVLIKQNRMSFRADHRSHLDLQVNLLAEQEATKILETLMRLSKHLGVEEVAGDAEAQELASSTPLEEIARDLDRRLGERPV